MAALTALVIAASGSQAFTWGAQPLAVGRHAAAAGMAGPGSVPPGPAPHAGPFAQPFPQPSPPAVVQPILCQGDPAPHLPAGFLMSYVGGEQIDGAGNVLILAILQGPEVTDANNLIDYYASPDDIVPVLWESQQAPEMPAGVIISYLVVDCACLAENGMFAGVPGVSGPGITPGYNDYVLYAGYPTALHKVLQGGDQAPGCETGVYIDVSQPGYFRGYLSDNDTLRVEARLAGPGVSYLNDSAVWVGPPDNLTLVYRDGMPAPGCEPGVTFAFGDLFVHNDSGYVSFRGGLTGPGVTAANDQGHWAGWPGALAKIAREGDQVSGMPVGITWKTASAATESNASGDIVQEGALQGPGITTANQAVLYLSDSEGLFLAGRGGDAVPEAGPGVTIALLGNTLINNRQEALYRVKFTGGTITGSNEWAMYFGPYGAAELVLRDGDPAPTFQRGTSLQRVVAVPQRGAMNDVGDVVAPTQIQGRGVTDADKVVLWMRHHVLQRWVPLLRSGADIDGRTLYAEDETAFNCGASGGGDGRHQKLNDAGMLAMRLEFTDGTHGIFRICFPFGDGNRDGQVDLADWALMQSCWTGPERASGCDCAAFDMDADGDVDLADQAQFQQLYQGG